MEHRGQLVLEDIARESITYHKERVRDYGMALVTSIGASLLSAGFVLGGTALSFVFKERMSDSKRREGEWEYLLGCKTL